MELEKEQFYQIKDRGLHLLQTAKWADCCFLVGFTPQNQRNITGHKLILAMASPVFERMFYGQLADKDNPIVIPDVQPDTFQSMLEYIYSDRVNIDSFDKACELCYVAKKYMLPRVVEQCTSFLWNNLNPSNACRAYEFAKLFDEPLLIQFSMQMISVHTREVLADPSFTDIEISTLMAIVEQSSLNIDSELDLFNALLRFANENGIFSNNSIQSSNHSTEQNSSTSGLLQIEKIKMEPDVDTMMESRYEYIDENYNQSESAPVDDVVLDNNAAMADTYTNGKAIYTAAESSQVSCCEPIRTLAATDNASNPNNFMETTHSVIDKEIFKKAVKKIRFLTMTPQQFAEGPARSKLLQQNEALAILIKISSPPNSDCPMPEGFCISRSSRKYYEQWVNQSELSSIHHIHSPNKFIPSSANVINQSEMDATNDHVEIQTLRSNSNSNQSIHNNGNRLSYNGFVASQSGDLDADSRREYCVRTVNLLSYYRNISVTDCSLTFQVDTNIWITGMLIKCNGNFFEHLKYLGIQVSTQVLCRGVINVDNFAKRYTEILYAHIQDNRGSRLSYTHYTSRAFYDSHLEISFHRPVYITRNQIYKIFVAFKKSGLYPMYSRLKDVICNRVKFRFNIGDFGSTHRDGLIRAIVFSTPPDNSRHILE